MAKNENKNYLNGSKSIGATFPDWVFQTLGPPEAKKKKRVWSPLVFNRSRGTVWGICPRTSSCSSRRGKKEICNLANVCGCPEGRERVQGWYWRVWSLLITLRKWEWSVKGKFCPSLGHIYEMAPFLFCTCWGSSARKAWLSVSWSRLIFIEYCFSLQAQYFGRYL